MFVDDETILISLSFQSGLIQYENDRLWEAICSHK